MIDEDFWKTVQAKERQSPKSQKSGALNIALLFGTAVIAQTLILTPMMSKYGSQRRLASMPDNYDNITTGSIKRSETGKRYTVRRSVLQETPGSVCIVEGYGADSGC